jgi:Na+/melibiose symporter-like transporter
VISKYEPKTIRETNYHAVLLAQLTDLYRARRERGFLAHGVISPQIWTATLVVGVLTLWFSSLFGHESRKLQFVMTSILAMAMAIIFSLILVFDRPFQGDVAVSNEPFTVIIHHLKANQAWFKKNAGHSQ